MNSWVAKLFESSRGKDKSRLIKRIFYLHVAKTAGSSFNAVLSRHFRGETHCEKYIERRLRPDGKEISVLGNVEHLRGLDFVSGHLPFPLLDRSEINLDDYFIVTVLRHPFAQTISHLNWVIKISEDETRPLYIHASPAAKDLSRKLRAVGEWTRDNIIYHLERYPVWFKNNQSRYFVADSRLSPDSVVNVLGRFSLVGITERFDTFVDEFEQQVGLPRSGKHEPRPRENRNEAYTVPSSVLQDPQLCEFLAAYNQIDMEMYSHVENVLAP